MKITIYTIFIFMLGFVVCLYWSSYFDKKIEQELKNCNGNRLCEDLIKNEFKPTVDSFD